MFLFAFNVVCSTASTQSWIFDIGVSPKPGRLWQPWRSGKQTAGFLTEFDLGQTTNSSFVFATVHGAGHEVPSYRPREALVLIKSFLNDDWDVGRRGME
jgi:carboxypeptidase C (cathepsin A)